jgi:hypothetical protein
LEASVRNPDNMMVFRALMLWDHNESPADKMRALFPDRPIPTALDPWYQEKLDLVTSLRMSAWSGAFDYPTQERIVALALEKYGAAAAKWVADNEGWK